MPERHLRRKPNPVAYDGFEPSGRMHIAQVIGLGIFINSFEKCEICC
jgi:tyrosyl-tRNA synthetase